MCFLCLILYQVRKIAESKLARPCGHFICMLQSQMFAQAAHIKIKNLFAAIATF